MEIADVSRIKMIMLNLPSEADSTRKKNTHGDGYMKATGHLDQDSGDAFNWQILSNKVARTAAFLALNHLYLCQEVVKYSLQILIQKIYLNARRF